MLTSEVFYLQKGPKQGRCYAAVVERGERGQILECIAQRSCASYKDAKRIASEMLALELSRPSPEEATSAI